MRSSRASVRVPPGNLLIVHTVEGREPSSDSGAAVFVLSVPDDKLLDTVSLVKGFSRLRAREAVLNAICGSRLRRPCMVAAVHDLKRLRRPDRRGILI